MQLFSAFPQGPERGFAGVDSRFDAAGLRGVLGIDAGGPQLEQRARRGTGQLGPVPRPGGQPEHGRLVRLQRDVRQLVRFPLDPVHPGILVPRRGQLGLQRDAELAQLLFVPLEHPLERLEQVGVTGNGLADLRRKRIKSWKRYTARLKSSGELLSLLAGLIRWTFGIGAVAILGSTISSLRPFAIGLGIVCLLAALLTKSAKITGQIVTFLEPGAEKEPLEETKANVQVELAKLSAPIVVMVDDLDRLTPSELLEMLQLVKANGDFPNLIYLLLCDRPTIERNIEEVSKAVSGREYIEKIVQVAFDVPLLDRKRLQQILFNGLDALIAFVLPPGDLSQTTIERLMAAAADREALRLELEALASRGLLELAVDRLEAYKQQVPLKHAVPFVTALFDIGDQLSSERAGMFEISSAMHAQRIIYWFLKQEQDPVQRGSVLRDAIEKTDGVNIPVGFISLIEPNPKGGNMDEEFVPVPTLQDLKALCVQKIKSALNAGSVPADLLGVLYRWREWAGPDEPAKYCQNLIQSDGGLLRFLRALTVCAKSHGMTDYIMTQHWYMRRRDVEAFVPFDAIESRVNGLPEGIALSQEDARALKAFNEAAERRRAGQPDEDPFGMIRNKL